MDERQGLAGSKAAHEFKLVSGCCCMQLLRCCTLSAARLRRRGRKVCPRSLPQTASACNVAWLPALRAKATDHCTLARAVRSRDWKTRALSKPTITPEGRAGARQMANTERAKPNERPFPASRSQAPARVQNFRRRPLPRARFWQRKRQLVGIIQSDCKHFSSSLGGCSTGFVVSPPFLTLYSNEVCARRRSARVRTRTVQRTHCLHTGTVSQPRPRWPR
jgi:hypothetical protein